MGALQHIDLKKMGVFRAGEIIKKGVPKVSISRWERAGKIIRLDRGFYIHCDAGLDPVFYDYALACKKFGKEALIGGLSALSYYGLIKEVPDQVWVIVPPNVRSQRRIFHLIRTVHDTNIGVVEKNYFRISNLERTLVESLRFSTKIGLASVLSAIRESIRKKDTNVSRLMAMAKKLGLSQFIVKHWEAINVE